jgi:hypothetical protein
VIILSGVLVVLAIALLIAGIAFGNSGTEVVGLDGLTLIYISIAVSIVSALCLAVGVFLRRRELFGTPGAGPDRAPAESKKARKKARKARKAAGGAAPLDPGSTLGGPAADDALTIPAPPVDVPADALVHVVRGRKRYHLDNCRQLAGRDKEELTYAEAQEEGFSPCTACMPDTALAARAAVSADKGPDGTQTEQRAAVTSGRGAVTGSARARRDASATTATGPAVESGRTGFDQAAGDRTASRSGGGRGLAAFASQPAYAESPADPAEEAWDSQFTPAAEQPAAKKPAHGEADSLWLPPATATPAGGRGRLAGASANTEEAGRAEDEGRATERPAAFADAATTTEFGAVKPMPEAEDEVRPEHDHARDAAPEPADATPAQGIEVAEDPDHGTAQDTAAVPADEAAWERAEEPADQWAEEPGQETTREDPVAASPERAEEPAGETSDPEEPAADDEGPQVRILSGTKRYHAADCALIEDIGDDADDLEALPRAEATARGCTPCLVCQPDKEHVRD